MIEHPELKEAYKKRHAHKRQYLSSWAKAKVRRTAYFSESRTVFQIEALYNSSVGLSRDILSCRPGRALHECGDTTLASAELRKGQSCTQQVSPHPCATIVLV